MLYSKRFLLYSSNIWIVIVHVVNKVEFCISTKWLLAAIDRKSLYSLNKLRYSFNKHHIYSQSVRKITTVILSRISTEIR